MAFVLCVERSQRIHEESLRNIQRLEEGGAKRRRYALPEEEEEMQVWRGEIGQENTRTKSKEMEIELNIGMTIEAMDLFPSKYLKYL